MTRKTLIRWSTDELETAVYSGTLDPIQKYEAERILREREVAPDRKLARRSYNVAAWALAFSVGTFIVALGIFWLIATGYRPALKRLLRAERTFDQCVADSTI